MTTTLKILRTAGAAVRHAGARPYLRVTIGHETVYLVGDLTSGDSIELVSPPQPLKGSQTTPPRVIVAQATFGHLERLGNANHAQSDPTWNGLSGGGERAFPLSDPAYESRSDHMANKWSTHGEDQAARRAAAIAAAAEAREAARLAAAVQS